MEVSFELAVFFYDDRDGQHDFLEVVMLRKCCEMSCVPQIGMDVIIGKNKDDISEHEIEAITWVENGDSLWVRVNDYETQINDGEHTDKEWEYFDGLIKDYIENDGWEVDRAMTRTTRKKWGVIND